LQLRQFIPYAGDTHQLQWRRTPESNWFMDTIRQVNSRGDKGETVQGLYVTDADGNAFGWMNNRDVAKTRQFLLEKLAEFRSATKSNNSQIPSGPSGEPAPPPKTTILRVYERVMPVPKGADPANENVQFDHFWLLSGEAQQLRNGVVPSTLPLRLCRFVFNDAVRGEPDMWTPSEIRNMEFSAKKEQDKILLSGKFSMWTNDRKRALQGSMKAEISFTGDRITDFKGFADTVAMGQSTYTPNPPEGAFPLKFAFILAPKDGHTVLPQATFFGNEYLTGKPIS
jgi:hypothetical protein